MHPVHPAVGLAQKMWIVCGSKLAGNLKLLHSLQKRPSVSDNLHCSRYDEVRVLDKSKEMVGVMSLTQAMGMAQAASMDVILINENAKPPLVRICSVSKFKYEIEKVKKEAQKKQRLSQQEIKELKLSPRTEVHDLQVCHFMFHQINML